MRSATPPRAVSTITGTAQPRSRSRAIKLVAWTARAEDDAVFTPTVHSEIQWIDPSALPALREMPFTVGVSLQEGMLAAWPREAEGVTLIELANGLVQRIASVNTEAGLRSALRP